MMHKDAFLNKWDSNWILYISWDISARALQNNRWLNPALYVNFGLSMLFCQDFLLGSTDRPH